MKIVYVDMDNVLVNFQSGIDALTEEERAAFKNDLDDVPVIFSKMKKLQIIIIDIKKFNLISLSYQYNLQLRKMIKKIISIQEI